MYKQQGKNALWEPTHERLQDGPIAALVSTSVVRMEWSGETVTMANEKNIAGSFNQNLSYIYKC